jgi:hypothetical protein
MGLFKTPSHRLRSLRAAAGLFAAAAILVVLIRFPLDAFGELIASAMFAGCMLLAAYNFWQIHALNEKTAEPPKAVSSQVAAKRQAQFYRCLLWIVLIAFPVIGSSIAVDLYQLDFGTSHQVVIPGPIVQVYENFGYWPAMLVVPALGMVCCGVLLVRIWLVNAHARKM